MKFNTFNNQKRVYCFPMLEVVPLDNEISLTLLSDLEPATEPDWSLSPIMNSSPLVQEML
jgi:hypothetical protein